MDDNNIAALSGQQLTTITYAPDAWLVPYLIAGKGTHLIWGAVSASDKTEFAVDLAISISSGATLLGSPSVIRPAAYLHFGKSTLGMQTILARKSVGGNFKLIEEASSRSMFLLKSIAEKHLQTGGVLFVDGLGTDLVRTSSDSSPSWLDSARAHLPDSVALIAVLPARFSPEKVEQSAATMPIGGSLQLHIVKNIRRLTISGRDVDERQFDYFGYWRPGQVGHFMNEQQQDVIDFLSSLDHGASPKEIAAAVGQRANSSPFLKMLQRMEEGGILKKLGHGEYAIPSPRGIGPSTTAATDDE